MGEKINKEHHACCKNTRVHIPPVYIFNVKNNNPPCQEKSHHTNTPKNKKLFLDIFLLIFKGKLPMQCVSTYESTQITTTNRKNIPDIQNTC